jgi:hypothetical protein
MPRPQFTLRALLVVLSLLSSALGVYHLFWRSQVAIEFREPDHVTLQWRLFRFRGQGLVPCEIVVVGRESGHEVVYKESVGVAVYRGWGRYVGKLGLSLRVPPGAYQVVLSCDASTLKRAFEVPLDGRPATTPNSSPH